MGAINIVTPTEDSCELAEEILYALSSLLGYELVYEYLGNLENGNVKHRLGELIATMGQVEHV